PGRAERRPEPVPGPGRVGHTPGWPAADRLRRRPRPVIARFVPPPSALSAFGELESCRSASRRFGSSRRGFLRATAVVVVMLTGEARGARGYIDIPPQSLARLCEDTKAIAVLRVEKVNREKRGVVYSKVRDLKGHFPTQGQYFGDTFTHVIRQDSP